MTTDSSKLIDRIGGSASVARLCCVSSQAVSKWRRDGIPPARLMFLKLAVPHVFDEPQEPQKAS